MKASLAMLTTRRGLLYRYGAMLDAPEADSAAIALGYSCAEELVRALADLKDVIFILPGQDCVWTALSYHRNGDWNCRESTHGTTCCHSAEVITANACDSQTVEHKGITIHVSATPLFVHCAYTQYNILRSWRVNRRDCSPIEAMQFARQQIDARIQAHYNPPRIGE